MLHFVGDKLLIAEDEQELTEVLQEIKRILLSWYNIKKN